jgi:chloramphenicol-sensitive protein RarD
MTGSAREGLEGLRGDRGPGFRGVMFGGAAFIWWGGVALYLPFLDPASPLEVVVFRILGTVVLLALALLLMRKGGDLRRLLAQPRTLVVLALAGIVIASNWMVFVWAVGVNRVVETALGAYMSPLLTVLIAVTILGEKLGRTQWCALGLASGAVFFLVIEPGSPPWVAIFMAATFSLYGLLKKKADAAAMSGLFVETILLLPASVGGLVWLWMADRLTFWSGDLHHGALLFAVGAVTGVPLLLFGAASTRIPLATLGLLQYLTPTVLLALGVIVFRERISLSHFFAFVLLWFALAIYSIAAILSARTGSHVVIACQQGETDPTPSRNGTSRSRRSRHRRDGSVEQPEAYLTQTQEKPDSCEQGLAEGARRSFEH